MCGIYCYIGNERTLDNLVQIPHRGPDNFATKDFDLGNFHIELAFWRLSIIDLNSSSNQPLEYSNGRFWIIFNGEIYNYIELREELKKHNYKFKTESDTEVLLAAYAAYGVNFLDKLRGMFAFVIFDREYKTLLAVRDRFGIKPLYYFNSSRGLCFASEIKQFIKLPAFESKLNYQRAFDFLAYGFLDHTDETLFNDVKQLRAGEYIFINLDRHKTGDEVEVRKWYNLKIMESDLTEEEAIENFKVILDETLKIHLRSDVKIGSCLSGGMDSSAIVCRINELYSDNKNFTQYVFSNCVNNQFDERRYVEELVRIKKLLPVYNYLKFEEINEKWEKSIFAQDEPFNSMSIIAQYDLFRNAKENKIKVMLDGQGADEILGSYDLFLIKRMYNLLRIFNVKELTSLFKNNKSIQLFTIIYNSINLFFPKQKYFVSNFYPNKANKFLNLKAWKNVNLSPNDLIIKKNENLYELSKKMIFQFPLPMLLHWEDRSSMINSIEARVPFLDHKLVEFLFSMSWQIKLKDGLRKYPLKIVMKNSVPQSIINRNDKIGFETEEKEFMKNRVAENYFYELSRTDSISKNLINLKYIENKFKAYQRDSESYSHLLWRVISFDKWCKKFNLNN
ncbi:MAG: asparagine synthase (glutamine-hydrolyzing) [Ignavibacteriaceae bacterium]